MKNREECGRLILLRREKKILSLLIRDNRLLRASACKSQEYHVGDIIIGKVMNVVQNIQAAFVDIGGGNLCFLPLQGIRNPILTNRSYDGRILAGDELVVQLAREAVRTKEPVLDTRLSFSGKYAVITIPGTEIRYSGKLTPKEKQRLKRILEEAGLSDRLSDMGLIVRTNAAKLLENHLLTEEIDGLIREARDVIEKAAGRTCYSVLRKAPEQYLTGLRDVYQEDYGRIVTDDPQLYEEMRWYLSARQPEDMDKLMLYEDHALSLNSLYGLEAKIRQALSRQVWLPSGGYLIIEPTEALTVIDVNTGRFIGNKKIEDTFYLINREACEEIAVQIPLRNLSGIILVDFINMKTEEHRREMMRYLTGLLQRDSVKTTVVDMTPLGLVEITRKKINKTLAEQMQE